MKVSIISAVYNKEIFIEDHINSLLNQDYKDIEFIFVNDGSTDNSYNIVKKYQNDPRVKIIDQKNQGQNIARKVGFLNSTGDLIYFVDSDDTLYDNTVISRVVEIFKNHKNVDFVIGQMINSFDNKDMLDKIIYTDDVKEGLYKIDYLYDKSFRFSLAYKIIKRAKIDPDYFFPTISYEDALVTYRVYDKCHKFYYYASPIYVVNRKSYNKRVTNSLNIKHVTEKYQNIKTLTKISNFAVSIKRLGLQSYLDDLNYSIKLNYQDKKAMIKWRLIT
jgi:glycosyltransferase involved in cell wall biosynthesis